MIFMSMVMPPQWGTAKVNVTALPSIDTRAQQRQAHELLTRHHRALASIVSRHSKEKMSRELLKMVQSSLPADQKHQAVAIARTIIEESRRQGLDPFFVMATIQTESGFDSTIKGTHGEVGLMQILPSTAQWITEEKLHKRMNLLNPRNNIRIGTAYMGLLRKQFTMNPKSYVTAYNMGPKNLRKLLGQNKTPSQYHDRVLSHYRNIYEQLNRSLNNPSKAAGVGGSSESHSVASF
jgi:soluble lytic murein transglycosylase